MKIKDRILTYYLRAISTIQFFLWGLSHIFYPKWYLTEIAGKDPGLLNAQNLLMVNEIGVSIIGISIATFIAASKPVKYYPIILMNFIIGLGSIGVTLYHILVRRASQEWGHIFTVLIMLLILAILYPWKELLKKS